MKKVAVLLPEKESIVSSMIGPFKVFKAANQYLRQCGAAQDFFQMNLVGLTRESRHFHEGLFSVTPDNTITDKKTYDLVIIPALMDVTDGVLANAPFHTWLIEQNQKGAEIASLCQGLFILGPTGLLKGKTCTTHWLQADRFRSMFPDVQLEEDKIITDQGGIYSSGGAYSFLNLLLYLVEKFCGRETSLFCSKLLEVDIDRYHQSQFAIFMGQKDHEDTTIGKCQEFVEANFEKGLSVEELALQFSLSKRNFIRRFKAATGNTPIEYIQRVRIEAAKKQLESTSKQVSEVMYEVGYSDSKAFRNVFRKFTGLSPVDYKKRFNRGLNHFEQLHVA